MKKYRTKMVPVISPATNKPFLYQIKIRKKFLFFPYWCLFKVVLTIEEANTYLPYIFLP